ncbi:hypothetical protein GGI35DRAFT_380559 [Trichoderma velutinum]
MEKKRKTAPLSPVEDSQTKIRKIGSEPDQIEMSEWQGGPVVKVGAGGDESNRACNIKIRHGGASSHTCGTETGGSPMQCMGKREKRERREKKGVNRNTNRLWALRHTNRTVHMQRRANASVSGIDCAHGASRRSLRQEINPPRPCSSSIPSDDQLVHRQSPPAARESVTPSAVAGSTRPRGGSQLRQQLTACHESKRVSTRRFAVHWAGTCMARCSKACSCSYKHASGHVHHWLASGGGTTLPTDSSRASD